MPPMVAVTPPRSRPSTRSVLIGLIVLAAAVRFGTLGAKGFWGDEISTVALVAGSLALATHYFAAFLVLPEAVILLRSAPRRRAAAGAVAFVALAGALLLPLALEQQAHGHADWIGNAPILGRLASTPLEFLVGFDLTARAVPVAGLVGLAAP